MRKHKHSRKSYSHWDVLLASACEPISPVKQQYQLLKMYEGLRSLEQSESPTFQDWIACSDAVNMMETLAEMGVCNDASGLLNDAIKALAEAGERYKKHNVLRLTGEGIAAIRAVLEDYAEIIKVVPARTMLQCHRATEARIQAILKGKGRENDVVVKPFQKVVDNAV
jgi:uncharacterized protein YyaL (SSP411 family)